MGLVNRHQPVVEHLAPIDWRTKQMKDQEILDLARAIGKERA